MEEILFVLLANLERERGQGREDVIGDGESELGFRGQGLGESDAQELGGTVYELVEWRIFGVIDISAYL